MFLLSNILCSLKEIDVSPLKSWAKIQVVKLKSIDTVYFCTIEIAFSLWIMLMWKEITIGVLRLFLYPKRR